MSELAVQSQPMLTADEARELTARICDRVTDLLPLIREAFERRADKALGYETWQEYCDTELNGLRLPVQERREAVAQLRQAGLSTRAIGAALGVSHTTAQRDLDSTGTNVPDESVQIVSLDGRQRPASRHMPVVVSSAIRDAIDEHEQETAKRRADREALSALAEELGLKRDPVADAEKDRLIKLLYPFFDAVHTIAKLPTPHEVIQGIRPDQRYHLDDLPAAKQWLLEFAAEWQAKA